MMHDIQLREDVLAELDWEPSIDAAHIGVTAENGVVTLTGHVATFAEKLAAERAARRVRGVRAIAQEIEVRPLHTNTASDDEIAKRAVKILDWDVLLPRGAVQVKVQQGWITLTGEVNWQYQRTAAEEDIRKLSGVKGVINSLTVKPTADANDIQQRIEAALKRNAAAEAKNVQVLVNDGRVTLTGKVRAWYERGMLEDAVWAAPGVKVVEDRLSVA